MIKTDPSKVKCTPEDKAALTRDLIQQIIKQRREYKQKGSLEVTLHFGPDGELEKVHTSNKNIID